MATVNGTRLSKGAGRAQRSRQSTQEQQAPEVQQRLQELELASLTIGLQVQRARPAFAWPHFLQNFTDPSNTHSHTFAVLASHAMKDLFRVALVVARHCRGLPWGTTNT